MEAKAASRAFSDVAALVKSAPLPIYSHCRIRDGRVVASNGVTDIDLPVDLDDALQGGILLPAQEMANLCRALAKSNSEIRMQRDGDRVHVAHDLGDIWLHGLSSDSCFPAADLEPFPDPLAEWSVSDLLSALQLVEPVLTGHKGLHGPFPGAYLEVYADGFSLVVLNGPRLCAFQNHGTAAQAIWKGLLPKNTISLLIKRLSTADGAGSVIFSGSSLGARFSFAEEHIGTRLIDADYPDWRLVLAARNDIPALVTLELLGQALDICSIARETSVMPIRLEFSKNRLSMAISTGNGEVQQTLSVEYGGGRLSLLLDGSLLADAIRAMGDVSEPVHLLHDGSPTRAVRMISADGRKICVIMPMRDA